MPTKTRNFYMPQTSMWNTHLVSESFVKLQLTRAQQSYADTDDALIQLDAEILACQREMRSVWSVANVQVMRAFEDRLKNVRREAKRIAFVRFTLRKSIDHMRQIAKEREWNWE